MLKTEVLKKTEKIASALYLITSFFDVHEPLKWRLRHLSTELVSVGLKDKTSTIKEVCSLASVAKNAGLVSETNCEILIQELLKLNDDMEGSFNIEILLENTKENESSQGYNRQYSLRDKKLLPRSIKDKTAQSQTAESSGVVSLKKNNRQAIILDILKNKKEVMIKDISNQIKDCGEKTIQRELLAMVEAGVLNKLGSKRWSRYSLA